MTCQIKGLRFECKTQTFFEGQIDGWILVFEPKRAKCIGRLDWVQIDDKYYIQMVEVDKEYRRKGVATELYKKLFEERKISKRDLYSTPKTSEGLAFRQNAKFSNLALKPNHFKVAKTYMKKEAAIGEWLQWMAQPVKTILQHHKEFVLGPVQDLVDSVIKAVAPQLVKQLAEAEVKEDIADFERGAALGKKDKETGKPPRAILNESEEFEEGYTFGYEKGSDKLTPQVRKTLIEEALSDFRKRVSVQVIVSLLKKLWHAVNPINTIKAMIAAVKKHGWKLGVGFALFEIFEHFVLPSLLTYLFNDPRLMTLATLPLGEVVYAVVLRALGRAPKELDKLSEQGHLDWYEHEIGPVRIACLRGV